MAVIALPTGVSITPMHYLGHYLGRACLHYVNWRNRRQRIRYVQMQLASEAVRRVRVDTAATLHGLEDMGGIRLLVRVFNAAYVGAGDYRRVGWIEASALQASKSYDPTLVWIACREGRPVGFCMARLRDGCGRITGLGVLPACRRQGIGAALMLCAMDELRRRGANGISLCVAGTNQESLRLYRRLGFQEVP